jgi:hypothetical protein
VCLVCLCLSLSLGCLVSLVLHLWLSAYAPATTPPIVHHSSFPSYDPNPILLPTITTFFHPSFLPSFSRSSFFFSCAAGPLGPPTAVYEEDDGHLVIHRDDSGESRDSAGKKRSIEQELGTMTSSSAPASPEHKQPATVNNDDAPVVTNDVAVNV